MSQLNKLHDNVIRLPFASIIIVNFNGEGFLRECFDSLESLNYPREQFEVILGDNASTDNSIAFTQANYPWVRIVKFDDNYGFCKPNNICAKEAKGEYLVFLNNDTFVDKNWLMELVLGVLSEPGIVSCASKILFPHLNAGNVINAAGGVIFPCGCGLYEGWMADDSFLFNTKKYTGFGCGAGVLVQRDFFLETGGFDEYYFYSGEEMDLGYRAWLTGHKVLYNPQALMYHYMGKTGFRGKGVTPTIEFLLVRNNLYFIIKNFEWYLVAEGLLLFEIRALLKITYALSKFNFYIVAAIFRAHWHLVKDIKTVFKNRANMQAHRKISDNRLREIGVLTTSIEVFRRYAVGMKNMKRFASGSLYDNKDAVKIKKNKSGDLVFFKP